MNTTRYWMTGALACLILLAFLVIHDKLMQVAQASDAVHSFKHGHAAERAKAARHLGERKERDAVPALIAALDDPKQVVVSAAAWALGEIGDSSAVDPLRKARVKFRPLFVDADAYNASCLPPIHVALRKLGSVDVLIRLLKEGDVDERLDAARDLGEKRARGAVPQLIRALKDEHPSVRSWAAWALGEIGDLAAVEPLIRAMSRYTEVARDDPFGFEGKCLTDFYVALEALTGEKYGLDALKWQRWWQSRGKNAK